MIHVCSGTMYDSDTYKNRICLVKLFRIFLLDTCLQWDHVWQLYLQELKIFLNSSGFFSKYISIMGPLKQHPI